MSAPPSRGAAAGFAPLAAALGLVLCAAAFSRAAHMSSSGGGSTALSPPLFSASAAAWTGDMCGGGAGAAPSRVSGGGGGGPRKSDIASVFSSIYSSLRWGGEGEGSGAGSSLRATASTRSLVELLVWRHRVTRLLDAPCGSAHWIPPLLARVREFAPCFVYSGLDVVESVVAANAGKPEFAGDARVSFAVADLSAAGAALPHGFDMILCRDALQHLPLLDAIDVLENFARAAPRLLAVGSYLDAAARWGSAPRNKNILTGDYYHISLLEPPFNLSAPPHWETITGAGAAGGGGGAGPRGRAEPLDILDERTPHDDPREHKFLLVYSGEFLASLDFAAMRAAAVTDFGATPRAGARAAATAPEPLASDASDAPAAGNGRAARARQKEKQQQAMTL
jgi:hypothetical protein